MGFDGRAVSAAELARDVAAHWSEVVRPGVLLWALVALNLAGPVEGTRRTA